MSTPKRSALSFVMWSLPLTFFAYQFILRLWPSLMMDEIMHQFAIDATAFGLLASVYYYGYAGMQIPIAIALERYSPRLIIFVCALICAIATAIFSFTSNWYLALFARFLVGVGSAVGFLGTSKVVSQWFPQEQYARMIGFTFTFGLLGAIYGGKPVSVLIDTLGWQKVAVILVGVAGFIGVFAYLFLRVPNNVREDTTKVIQLKDFKDPLCSPVLWVLGGANLLMVGALEGFADVWGVNYLMAAYKYSRGDAAELVSFIFVGMLFGGPLLALLGRLFGNYTIISLCGFGMAAVFLQLILLGNSWYVLVFLFFCVGMMCCYQVLVFAAGSNFVSAELLGITIAFLNCINMLGGAFFHAFIGFVMDVFWTGDLSHDGIRIYTLESYNYALMVILLCAALGALIVATMGLRLRKTVV